MTIALAIIALFIAVVLALAASKSDHFEVKRTAAFKAPPEKAFALINDFHEWKQWSPWEPLDPNMERTHSGAALGKGAVYNWSGNKKVGRGRMEITDSSPHRRIILDLHFMEPFEARNVTTFEFQPEDGGTQCSWSMSGKRPFPMKVMSVFMDMDKLVGKDFEKGLANLKQQIEAA